VASRSREGVVRLGGDVAKKSGVDVEAWWGVAWLSVGRGVVKCLR
jgi:hypothetical protein